MIDNHRQAAVLNTDVIDIVGMLSLGAYCFFVSLFYSDFAEIHITLSFLNFPIFISEVLLVLLSLLLLLKLWITQGVRRWHWGWGIYLGGVVVWALWEYFQSGPLALRNAALFYYIAFALLGFSFYNERFLTHRVMACVLFAILIGGLFFRWASGYYWYTYIILTVILLLKNYPKHSLWAIPVILLLAHIETSFLGSRAHLIGLLMAIVFISYVVIFKMVKWQRIYRVGFLGGVGVLLLTVIMFASDHNALKTLTTPGVMCQLYRQNKMIVDAKKDKHVLKPVVIKIYRNNNKARQEALEVKLLNSRLDLHIKQASLNLEDYPYVRDIFYPSKQVVVEPIVNEMVKEEVLEKEQVLEEGLNTQAVAREVVELKEPNKQAVVEPIVNEVVKEEVLEEGLNTQAVAREVVELKEPSKQVVVEPIVNKQQEKESGVIGNQYRNLDEAYCNMLFRLFIWEDMYNELLEGRHLFGVGLSKAQRSKSLEILGWGETEWGRDGWIAPHNSFFHMIYRAGVVGLLVVFGLLFTLVYLTRLFIRRKDISGILLVSVVIYWSCMSIFSVTLELPYNAILFWSLLGMTFAYASSNVTNDKDSGSIRSRIR